MSTKTPKEASNEALDEAIAILKAKGLKLWKELGLSRGAIPQWKDDDREIPARHCLKIEALTDNRVTSARLNPKVFAVESTSAGPPGS